MAILPLPLIYQLMAKRCTLRIGKLPLEGLPMNSMVRITDRYDITLDVYRARKATGKKIKKNKKTILTSQ